MNTKRKLAILALVAVALAVSYWTGYVHGSRVLTAREMFISIVLPIIFLWTLSKLTFAWLFKRGSLPPSGGGSPPPPAPSPGVPAPRPPGAPPEIYCEHAA